MRSWEETQPGQMIPSDQRDIPYHVTSCSVYKVGEERGGVGHLEWWCLFSQVTVKGDGALLSWEWLNTCLPLGTSELIPSFPLLVCTAFAFSIKLSLSPPRSFPAFTLLLLPPFLLVVEWERGCVGLDCWLRLNHNHREKSFSPLDPVFPSFLFIGDTFK